MPLWVWMVVDWSRGNVTPDLPAYGTPHTVCFARHPKVGCVLFLVQLSTRSSFKVIMTLSRLLVSSLQIPSTPPAQHSNKTKEQHGGP